MNVTNVFTGAVAVLALVLSFAAFSQPGQVERVVEKVVGSASSPSVVGGCMDINGVTECHYRQAMKRASTTCAFKAPANASSTLMYATAFFTESAAGAYSLEWGKAFNSAFATTTSLGNLNTAVAANGDYVFSASTTPTTQIDPAQAIASTDWVNLKLGSTTPSDLTLRNSFCSAGFRVL